MFQRKFGDTDGDGDVDTTNVFAFGNAFGSSIGSGNYRAELDYDNDGDVDTSDLFQFSIRLGS